MKIGLSGGYVKAPLEVPGKTFQSIPEYLLYDGLMDRGHEVIPLSTSSIPFVDMDILHCHHYSRILHYASILRKTPVVFTPHNPFIFEMGYKLRWRDRFSLKRIDALVVLSERERQIYEYRDFKRANKIHVIPNGLKVSLYERPRRLISRLKYCIPDDRILVLFVGQLLSYKGLEYLFKSIDGLDLTLVVKTHHAPDLSKYQAMAPDNTIFITDILSQRELTDLYYSCDIYCQPSLAEALPTVITEAMMCARPIIATTVGGIPEQLPEKCGYLVDPKNIDQLRDGLKFLADKPDFREYIGENARAHALKTYTQNQMVEKHIELYASLLN